MRRPWIIWLIFATCAAAVFAATGWISMLVIDLDRRDTTAQRQADREEQIRLALWRADAALMPLIARENARPYFQYSAFYPAQQAYSNKQTTLNYGDVLMPSPLLAAKTPYVKLYFQIDEDGRVTSPQTPTGEWLKLAASRYDMTAQLNEAANTLSNWRADNDVKSLRSAAEKNAEAPAPEAQATVQANEAPAANEPLQQAAVAQLDEQSQQSFAQQKQTLLNAAEYAKRRDLEAQSRGLSKAGNSVYESLPGSISQGEQKSSAPNASAADAVQIAKPQAAATSAVDEGEMRAAWLNGELVLLRQVRVDGRELVQGCWLDWPAIRTWLVSEMKDVLPGVTLEAVTDAGASAGGDTRMLAAAPIRIVPGPMEYAALGLSDPVRRALMLAWIGVVTAVAAAGLLLRGAVALSERRGAFVSAVTHELRTPLTTFRMYTQMLADGMVRDEEKRGQYLRTLRTESDRLGHLVENVLAYARLERVKLDRRAEDVTLGALIERVHDRLDQRALQAGMTLGVDIDDAMRATLLRTDIGAVDQILFNLVDNACKYARQGRIELTAKRGGAMMELRVRDQGPGVGADVKRRLFRPFSKSATAAAGSAPGVGLGLALSRRLARSLGGALMLESSGGAGACFVLVLPVRDAGGRGD
ncbi:MAG: sensor histidine kinase [Planctomycetes bacterium]|nr:sensor histidine kinase [Planctomycetota bacterium]